MDNLTIKLKNKADFDTAFTHFEGNNYCYTSYESELAMRFPYEFERNQAAEVLMGIGVMCELV